MDALVTCMYNGLWGTSYGGRLNRDQMYRESLVTIGGAGVPIHCFVPQADVEPQRAYFESRATPLDLVPLELEDVPHHAEIQAIKAGHPEQFAGPAWQERCVEVMWGKLFMLEQTLRAHPEAESVYWIDAGLANANIISTKYISRESLAARRLSEVGAAFPPKLFARIREFAGDALLVILSSNPHNPGVPEKYNQRPYASGAAVVGGLFGGPRARVAELCGLFEQRVRRLLEDRVLFFEESILTGIVNDLPELFRTFRFESWYHEGWSAHDPKLTNFSQFFDLLLETPTPAEIVKLPW